MIDNQIFVQKTSLGRAQRSVHILLSVCLHLAKKNFFPTQNNS